MATAHPFSLDSILIASNFTANNAQTLLPEFTRKGRIDEILVTYLPNEAERRDILVILVGQCRRSMRSPDDAVSLGIQCVFIQD